MTFTRFRIGILAAALLLLLLAWVQVGRAKAGLVTRRLEQAGVPMQFVAPAGAQQVPGILIAHGFGGSKQLMLAYGYVLAQAGYGVLLWDFAGHAANPAPLDRQGDVLQANLDVAYATLIAQPEVDGTRIALLGHSMGSGAVMTAAIRDVERYQATVAVSPTGADVSPEAPRNLLLQAGALEPQFAANAERLLAAAGGANDDLAGGRGRAFHLIPGVEHITILFSPDSHQSALAWLDRTFARSSDTAYRDSRILWYLIHLLAGSVALVAAAPLFPWAKVENVMRPRRRWDWVGLPAAALLATGLLFLLSRLIDILSLGGMVVGGALGVWLLFFGGGLLLFFRPTMPAPRALVGGILVFVLLSFIFGALAHLVWLPWWLIPMRLLRWPLLALFCLPWTVAAAHGAAYGRWSVHLGWWLGQTLFIISGLLLAIFLIPGLFVLILVIPLFPLIVGLMTLANAAVRDPWACGLGNGLFFAWLLLAYFPLAG
ncbi:MAG: alpha/beta fold hydrolase [Anaerolineae bacterium]|nr:alpha/beta fold hydrolase [Anaerolineae bacterium]